jgi:glycosyltransferase involved in cell wall biosynthesis
MAERQIRILHVLGTLNPGGVETWLLHVLRNIDRDKFHLEFCTFGEEPGLYAPEAEKLGSTVLWCRKSANLWAFGRRFRGILREGKYDVVHSHVHSFSGAVLRWAKAEGVPMRIAHSHNTYDGKSDALPRRYYRRLMKSWITRYATHGLAASKAAAAALFGEDWQNDHRVRVLYYGIDLRPFQEPVDRAAVRRELGLPIDAPTVGHVGRFDPQKNHHFLLEIAAEVLKKRPEIHFLLVGDGPLRPEIERRAKSMGLSDNVHFLGVRTDVPRLMCGAMDVFLFPSLWEGLPVTLIEAQAAGLQCLVSATVPDEVVFLPESVQFLSLLAGVNIWATQFTKGFNTYRPGLAAVLAGVSQTTFSIQHSLTDLASVYSSGQGFPALTVGQDNER